MKQFISDTYHYIMSIVMIFPIHYIRISFLRFLRMQIGNIQLFVEVWIFELHTEYLLGHTLQ